MKGALEYWLRSHGAWSGAIILLAATVVMYFLNAEVVPALGYDGVLPVRYTAAGVLSMIAGVFAWDATEPLVAAGRNREVLARFWWGALVFALAFLCGVCAVGRDVFASGVFTLIGVCVAFILSCASRWLCLLPGVTLLALPLTFGVDALPWWITRGAAQAVWAAVVVVTLGVYALLPGPWFGDSRE